MGIYLKPVFKLFVPLLIAHFGMFSMSLVDSVMLGHSSAEHVGLQSIGDTPVTLVLLLLNGLLQGTLFTTAQAFGKNDFPAAGQSLRTALVNGLWLSLMTIPCLIFAPQLISLFDYTPEQTGAAASVTRILSGAIPFSIMFFICMFFLNGIKKTWIITAFVLAANVLNIFLDWILINGLFGFPRLLSAGAAWATTIVRMFLGCGLLSYILLHPCFKKFQIWKRGGGRPLRTLQRQLGLSATANLLSYEAGAACCLFFAAHIGILQASAYTLAYRIYILSNIIGVAFAVAGTVLSGKYVSGTASELRKIYSATIKACGIVMLPLCLLCFLGAGSISALLTSNPELSRLTAPLLQIAAAAMFMRALNSIQIILLRNIHYLLAPSFWYGLIFILIMPACCVWWGSLTQTAGVMWALVAGNAGAAVVLHYLFIKKSTI